MVAGVLVQEKEWEICSVERMRAAAALLPHKQPTDLVRVESDMYTPTTELKPVLGAVKAAGYEGKLRLDLMHYLNKIPCVQQLKGAK